MEVFSEICLMYFFYGVLITEMCTEPRMKFRFGWFAAGWVALLFVVHIINIITDAAKRNYRQFRIYMMKRKLAKMPKKFKPTVLNPIEEDSREDLPSSQWEAKSKKKASAGDRIDEKNLSQRSDLDESERAELRPDPVAPVVIEKILLNNGEWVYKEKTGPKNDDWAFRSGEHLADSHKKLKDDLLVTQTAHKL